MIFLLSVPNYDFSYSKLCFYDTARWRYSVTCNKIHETVSHKYILTISLYSLKKKKKDISVSCISFSKRVILIICILSLPYIYGATEFHKIIKCI